VANSIASDIGDPQLVSMTYQLIERYPWNSAIRLLLSIAITTALLFAFIAAGDFIASALFIR
jgi:hypothetical protein